MVLLNNASIDKSNNKHKQSSSDVGLPGLSRKGSTLSPRMHVVRDTDKPIEITDWKQLVNPKDKFTILVFFRGGWCSTCKAHLTSINPHVERIKELGGSVYAISAEDKNARKT